MVGATGFEPATSSSRTKRSTKLSHAPTKPPSILIIGRPSSFAEQARFQGEQPTSLERSSSPMRYLIVGCGRVGSALAKLLDADGHEVIVVDENPTAFKRLGTNFRGHVVVGTGIDYDILKRAGAQ